MSPMLRSAAGSDVGRRRPMNQDSAATSSRLLVVADGMGGHAHGEVASSVAVAAFLDLEARLRSQDLAGLDLLAELGGAVQDAGAKLTALCQENSELRGSGTTVVAMLADGTRIGLVHIGDSRAYLLRGGSLHRLTRDHTLVQSLVDEGRITEADAAEHPRRSWLIRTLQEGSVPEPDLIPVDGVLGDRYLICSDGVTAVVPDVTIGEVLASIPEPHGVVERLIELANAGGGPDNITCVVADLLEGEPAVDLEPTVVGAALTDH